MSLIDAGLVEQLLDGFYRPRGIALRGCQPRDLIDQALSLAEYLGEPRQLTPELLEGACAGYFVADEEPAPVLRVSALARSVLRRVRGFAGGLLAAAMLLAPGSSALPASARRLTAAGARNAVSVRITSPLGRARAAGRHPHRRAGHPRAAGRPWVRSGSTSTTRWSATTRRVRRTPSSGRTRIPFEPTRIRVEASDAPGNVVSDAIELAPFEIVETTGVSRACCSKRP